jgi:DNA-binding MarR family transcriptional regulator
MRASKSGSLHLPQTGSRRNAMASSRASSAATSPSGKSSSLVGILRAIEAYREHMPSHSLLFFETFLIIAARGPVVPTDIARSMGVPKAVITGALKGLGSSRRFPKSYTSPPRLIDRVDHPVDARYRLAALSPKGRQLVAEMRAALRIPPRTTRTYRRADKG